MSTPNPGGAGHRPPARSSGCLSVLLLAGCALSLFCLLVLPVLLIHK